MCHTVETILIHDKFSLRKFNVFLSKNIWLHERTCQEFQRRAEVCTEDYQYKRLARTFVTEIAASIVAATRVRERLREFTEWRLGLMTEFYGICSPACQFQLNFNGARFETKYFCIAVRSFLCSNPLFLSGWCRVRRNLDSPQQRAEPNWRQLCE